MCSHDAVAQKDYYPRLSEIPQDLDEDEETVKIVQLVKSNEPLVSVLYSPLFCLPKFECQCGLLEEFKFSCEIAFLFCLHSRTVSSLLSL